VERDGRIGASERFDSLGRAACLDLDPGIWSNPGVSVWSRVAQTEEPDVGLWRQCLMGSAPPVPDPCQTRWSGAPAAGCRLRGNRLTMTRFSWHTSPILPLALVVRRDFQSNLC